MTEAEMIGRARRSSEVLTAVPEGWTAQLATGRLTRQQLDAINSLRLEPGQLLRAEEVTTFTCQVAATFVCAHLPRFSAGNIFGEAAGTMPIRKELLGLPNVFFHLALATHPAFEAFILIQDSPGPATAKRML